VTARSHAVDVRRRAGWLPDQDDLESWLAGHQARVEARGEQVVLHPVLVEFQELMDTDPVVRMYVNQNDRPGASQPSRTASDTGERSRRWCA